MNLYVAHCTVQYVVSLCRWKQQAARSSCIRVGRPAVRALAGVDTCLDFSSLSGRISVTPEQVNRDELVSRHCWKGFQGQRSKVKVMVRSDALSWRRYTFRLCGVEAHLFVCWLRCAWSGYSRWWGHRQPVCVSVRAETGQTKSSLSSLASNMCYQSIELEATKFWWRFTLTFDLSAILVFLTRQLSCERFRLAARQMPWRRFHVCQRWGVGLILDKQTLLCITARRFVFPWELSSMAEMPPLFPAVRACYRG